VIMIKWDVKTTVRYTLIEFELPGPIEPKELKSLIPPTVNFHYGVILSGRGPIWLYGYLIHYYHPAPWIAVHDPRLGAVIVASHRPDLRPGDIIPL